MPPGPRTFARRLSPLSEDSLSTEDAAKKLTTQAWHEQDRFRQTISKDQFFMVSFRAIGAIDAGFRERAAEGWAELIVRLKTLVETGARLGIAPDPPHKEKKR